LTLERLQKILAKAGVASRREAERMIVEGRVTVNGEVISQLGVKADPSTDHIKIDGKRLARFEPNVTLLLNKPRGYVSTVKDPQGRQTVTDLLGRVKARVYPVGRLDFDAEGLLLLTNDGDLAHVITHPRYSVPKIYLAKVSGIPEERKLVRLIRGISLEDGRARAESVSILRQVGKNSWLRIVVTEGRTHLIKRMFSAVGHPVAKLKRIGIGSLRLGNLPVGQFRYLAPEEVERLRGYSGALGRENRRRAHG
jgi:23S rRNA pseudouridine2605 synthase